MASIANIKETAVLQTFGTEVESDENLEKDESETDTDVDDDEEDCAWNAVENTSVSKTVHDRFVGDMAHQFSLSKEITETTCYQNSQQIMDILKSCELNWLHFVEVIKEKMNDYSKEAIGQLLLNFGGQLHLFNFEEREELIIEQS